MLPAEYEVVDGALPLEVCGHVQYVLLPVQRPGEGLALDNTVQRELVPLPVSCHSDHLIIIIIIIIFISMGKPENAQN